jgi:hypothetical protein
MEKDEWRGTPPVSVRFSPLTRKRNAVQEDEGNDFRRKYEDCVKEGVESGGIFPFRFLAFYKSMVRLYSGVELIGTCSELGGGHA